MAKRGPKPKPTSIKLLKGTRKDRVNLEEPAKVAGDPICPDHLDGMGKAEFQRLVDLMRSTGVLSKVDGGALALYCQTYSRWVQAEASVSDFGLLVATDSGSVKQNPAVAIAQQSVKTLHRLLVEFGLTPSSRSRLTVAQAQPADKLEEFLRKKAR